MHVCFFFSHQTMCSYSKIHTQYKKSNNFFSNFLMSTGIEPSTIDDELYLNSASYHSATAAAFLGIWLLTVVIIHSNSTNVLAYEWSWLTVNCSNPPFFQYFYKKKSIFITIKTIFKRFYSVDNNSTQGIRAMAPCTGDKIPNQKWPFSREKK